MTAGDMTLVLPDKLGQRAHVAYIPPASTAAKGSIKRKEDRGRHHLGANYLNASAAQVPEESIISVRRGTSSKSAG
jgi:hypothetical protein